VGYRLRREARTSHGSACAQPQEDFLCDIVEIGDAHSPTGGEEFSQRRAPRSRANPTFSSQASRLA